MAKKGRPNLAKWAKEWDQILDDEFRPLPKTRRHPGDRPAWKWKVIRGKLKHVRT